MDVLANWLWQGCAVALAATAILRTSRRMSATTRYHLWWVTLAVVLVLPLMPWLVTALDPGGLQGTSAAGDRAAGGLSAPVEAGAGVVLPAFPSWTVSLLIVLWSVVATVSFSRTFAALVTLGRAKRTSRPFPESREARLHTWLSLRARGRRAELAVSDSVRAAAVLGLTSPSIVVAPGVLGALDLGGLSDAELDQIVVHEWAHVQRRDDVACLVQRVIGALAGLHPAVWWIDRQLHIERETACDDWAVNATGSARGLAVCLTKLAALPDRPADAVLLPAALLSSELTTRVVRLLDRRRNTSTTRTLGAAMLVAPVLGALGLTFASVELVVTSPIARDRPRETVSAAPAVPAIAQSTAVERGVTLPNEGAAVASGSARPLQRSRGSARTPARTRAQASAERDRSERGVALGRADGAVSSTSQPTQRDRAVPVMAHPLVVERQLGSEDLPGPTETRTPVAADIITAATGGAVVPAGAQAPRSPTLWGAAADAGVTVGKGSQKAAVATAGFFTRLSKSITGVF